MNDSSVNLRNKFHSSIRLTGAENEPAPGILIDRDGPVVRRYPQEPGASFCMVECPSGLGEDPDALIKRQVNFFSARDEKFEWKTYDYDEPIDLGERLKNHGFITQDPEALVLGDLRHLIHQVDLPPGCRVDVVAADDDSAFADIAGLMAEVWGSKSEEDDRSPTASLRREKQLSPHTVDIVAVYDERGEVVCAGWVRYSLGSEFASLWGGSTRARWRRKGLYRATVSLRAQLAAARGMRYMRVDCSPDSEPVLTRLGLRRVATTTPYIFTP